MDPSELRGVSPEGLPDEFGPVVSQDALALDAVLAQRLFSWSKNLAATAAPLSPTISWQTAVRVATSTAVICHTAPMALSRPT